MWFSSVLPVGRREMICRTRGYRRDSLPSRQIGAYRVGDGKRRRIVSGGSGDAVEQRATRVVGSRGTVFFFFFDIFIASPRVHVPYDNIMWRNRRMLPKSIASDNARAILRNGKENDKIPKHDYVRCMLQGPYKYINLVLYEKNLGQTTTRMNNAISVCQKRELNIENF